jgi:hypothetical protein
MKRTLFFRHQNTGMLILLLIISAVVYLPRLNQIGYLNDDWYLMYSAHAYGRHVFADIFSGDRPARALVMIPAYTLFGDQVFYFNLSAYFFRLVSGISFFWLLNILWPRQKNAAFFAALLFLMYPGFLSQYNGIDYQSQMVSLASAMLSIALSVRASGMQNPVVKWFLLILATVLGWFYLGLVEYFLGLELLRLGSLYLLGSRGQDSGRGNFLAGVCSCLPGLIIPLVFLAWRVFYFESERGATDIGGQLEQFRQMPFVTGIWWLMHLLTNTLSVTFFAWGVPFYQLIGYIRRLRDLFIAVVSVVVVLLSLFWIVRLSPDEERPEIVRDWRNEFLVLGIVVAAAGLIPVILVNRQPDFWSYSRYTLASSPGSALVLVSILFFLTSNALRWGLLSLIVTVSVFSHHANAIRLADETNSLRAFWWQVAWRIPQLKMDTTLIVNYPITSIEEDYFVWGPANLIYYPDGIAGDQIRPGVSALVLNPNSLHKILTGAGRERDNRRSIITMIDYQNVLVVTMPIQGACARVINGTQPELSQYEEERVTMIASYSDPAHIDLDAEHAVPPELVFGPEPAHDWCYFFEKADLARQRGDWDEVTRLGNEALKQDLVPQDTIEWMPFLQAYARAGNVDRLNKIRRLMKGTDPYVTQQVCQSIRGMSELSDQVIEAVDSFCIE